MKSYRNDIFYKILIMKYFVITPLSKPIQVALFAVFFKSLETARWILSPTNCLSLICHLETPTFYQTLAGVTHCKSSNFTIPWPAPKISAIFLKLLLLEYAMICKS